MAGLLGGVGVPVLLEFARRAGAIAPAEDRKLQGAVREVKAFLKEGFHPVVFCRFVDTADYVARHLRGALPDQVRVESVTGRLPPAEREARIGSLATGGGRFVLVCTDCLSEGVNLQEHFDAVLHYDLAWNPTRHEQREGRVDRFGQEKREVRAITYYGTDNPIDGVILDILIRKHKSIKNDLGVTVAVPGSGEQIAEALFEGALFREQAGTGRHQLALDFIDDLDAETRAIHAEWENARDREKASRSRFAQHGLKPEAVAAELEHVRAAIGRSEDVARFFTAVLRAANVPVRVRAANGAASVAGIAGGRTRTHANAVAAGRTSADARTHANGTDNVANPVDTAGAADATSPANGTPDHGRITVHVSPETPRALRQAIGQEKPFTGRFDLPLPEGEIHLGRMSPVVKGLASWTLDQALDPESRDAAGSVASRCGAIVTSAMSARTTLLVARFRYHLRRAAAGAGSRHGGAVPGFNEPGHGGPEPRPGANGDTILCEEIAPLACTGPAEAPHWLSPEEGERLLAAEPERNLLPTAVEQQLGVLLPALPAFQAALASVANERAEAQRAAHERVRTASRTRAAPGGSRGRGRVAVEPVLPVDILGAYVLLPVLPPARP